MGPKTLRPARRPVSHPALEGAGGISTTQYYDSGTALSTGLNRRMSSNCAKSVGLHRWFQPSLRLSQAHAIQVAKRSRFGAALLPNDSIEVIKYFTARVSARPHN